jgi:hypothetical protein
VTIQDVLIYVLGGVVLAVGLAVSTAYAVSPNKKLGDG